MDSIMTECCSHNDCSFIFYYAYCLTFAFLNRDVILINNDEDRIATEDDVNERGGRLKDTSHWTLPIEHESQTRIRTRGQILSEYNSKLPPPFLDEQFTICTRANISSFQVASSKLFVAGNLSLNWNDIRLAFDPFSFLHPHQPHLEHSYSPDEIWTPQINFKNGKVESASCSIKADFRGQVKFTFPTQLETSCGLNMLRWPFNSHVCSLKMTMDSYVENNLNHLSIITNGLTLNDQDTVNIDYRDPIRDWQVLEYDVQRKLQNCTQDECEPKVEVDFYFSIRKNSTVKKLLFALPLIYNAGAAALILFRPTSKLNTTKKTLFTLILLVGFLGYFLNNHRNFLEYIPGLAFLYALQLTMAVMTLAFLIFSTHCSIGKCFAWRLDRYRQRITCRNKIQGFLTHVVCHITFLFNLLASTVILSASFL